MKSKDSPSALLWVAAIFLAQLFGCSVGGGRVDDRQDHQPRYFASPQQAVSAINDLLRKRDWPTLSRYYDLNGSAIDSTELESGHFFMRADRPVNADPAGLWRYRQPFAPGSVFDHERSTEQSGVLSVVVAIEIDEGGGMKKRGLSEFKMRRSAAGYQLIP